MYMVWCVAVNAAEDAAVSGDAGRMHDGKWSDGVEGWHFKLN